MRTTNTAGRLAQIMGERNLKQADLVRMCDAVSEKYDYKTKISKSDMSQYVNGWIEPGSKKLTILGLALDVSEAWLMGLEVPKERRVQIELSKKEAKLIAVYRMLDDAGKAFVDLVIERESKKHKED